MSIQAFPISDHCRVLYERGEHAVLGISPYNSYFSEHNIKILLEWGWDHFSSLSLLIPDEASQYTLMALGYDEAKAKKKSADSTSKCNGQ
uniref:Cyclodipeptide synthase n=1 Tax=Candidatus Kentrum eta TaxID=2126337 RepID=A0A450VSQ2_9GAMM|nr:MAG: tRNA-dependent cyclodipeptide synthase [Candidatus Kentron sp. H]VFK04532.1 MAG: tRNA-dependent cyclodipeptide synthase [Candidatus Kentron sp. H]VFK07807.1 MAG: tRNA-dependent cyclodipeptide synthase [Candidatus Kentron sp. H]